MLRLASSHNTSANKSPLNWLLVSDTALKKSSGNRGMQFAWLTDIYILDMLVFTRSQSGCLSSFKAGMPLSFSRDIVKFPHWLKSVSKLGFCTRLKIALPHALEGVNPHHSAAGVSLAITAEIRMAALSPCHLLFTPFYAYIFHIILR